jgi:hypothetical protein
MMMFIESKVKTVRFVQNRGISVRSSFCSLFLLAGAKAEDPQFTMISVSFLLIGIRSKVIERLFDFYSIHVSNTSIYGV